MRMQGKVPMKEWPPFVVETPAGEPGASPGWEEVVFVIEDSLAPEEDEPAVGGAGPLRRPTKA
jgi:hypothetical protein